MKLAIRTLIALVITGLAVVHIASSSQKKIQGDRPTVINQKVMTNRQTEHGKLFKYYSLDQKIPETVADSTEDIEIRIGTPLPGGSPDMPPFSFQRFLRDLTCEADVVVIGRVRSKSSYLTEDETFIFSEYEIKVKELIKNNKASSVEPDSTITVVYPGGTVLFDGRRVRAVDSSFKLLGVKKEYLLFLKYIPETGAYKIFNSRGNFLVNDGKLFKLTDEAMPGELEGAIEAHLTTQINAAISKGCSKEE